MEEAIAGIFFCGFPFYFAFWLFFFFPLARFSPRDGEFFFF